MLLKPRKGREHLFALLLRFVRSGLNAGARAAAFASLTRSNVGRRLAVILDGELNSAPVIRSPIEGGSAVISGDFSREAAFNLAIVLEAPLAAPVTIVEEKPF